ncbi:hypothetical protein BG261_02930 [Floricoccus tropicus]|uniref:DUF2187 domain-containing protein n=1 Tax=Floricoccus tropicus TaxID=1859473 RepID=A0A1E8GMS6_9LACT|nr:hypothetical protein [Floricoccus tropicus]OFI49549.1 hypothetical protein BG261_02930 [Floricoccus tropicus]
MKRRVPRSQVSVGDIYKGTSSKLKHEFIGRVVELRNKTVVLDVISFNKKDFMVLISCGHHVNVKYGNLESVDAK